MLPEIELKKSHQSHKAFTIIELSIVVTVISLLLLLISQGARFLESTHLKSIYNEAVKYKLAVSDFKQKYQFLPGDFPHADQYFSTRCAATSSDCNGDGDGFVKTINLAEKNSSNYSEPLLLWRHLALSGYVSGTYSGKAQEIVGDRDCDSYYLCCTSTDCPSSSYNQAIYSYYSWPIGTGSNNQCQVNSSYYPKNINILYFGQHIQGGNNLNAVISPEKAYLLDLKFDDAIPTKGLIQARSGENVLNASIGPCLVDSSGSNVSNDAAYGESYFYNFAISGDQCSLAFLDLENSICQLD